MHVYTYISIHIYLYIVCTYVYLYTAPRENGGFKIIRFLQPIADRLAQNLEIVFKTFETNQNSAHDENPGTPGTKLKVVRNNLSRFCATLSAIGCKLDSLAVLQFNKSCENEHLQI